MSTVTVVATVEADNLPPRVRLDVTDIGSPSLFEVTVTRLDPDGRQVPVRTTDGGPLTLVTSGVTRVGIVYDYEMPYGEIVQYSTVEDPASSSGDVTVPSDDVWLIHVGVPDLSQPIQLRIGSFDEETLPVQQGVFYPMGRRNPIVVTDGSRHGPQSYFTVGTETLAETAALRALVYDAGTLLLNVPASLGLGVESAYIAVSNVSITRPSNIGTDPRRDMKMPYTVVDRPSGGSQAERSYVDLLEYSSYADLLVAYPTYFDLLAGP